MLLALNSCVSDSQNLPAAVEVHNHLEAGPGTRKDHGVRKRSRFMMRTLLRMSAVGDQLQSPGSEMADVPL